MVRSCFGRARRPLAGRSVRSRRDGVCRRKGRLSRRFRQILVHAAGRICVAGGQVRPCQGHASGRWLDPRRPVRVVRRRARLVVGLRLGCRALRRLFGCRRRGGVALGVQRRVYGLRGRGREVPDVPGPRRVARVPRRGEGLRRGGLRKLWFGGDRDCRRACRRNVHDARRRRGPELQERLRVRVRRHRLRRRAFRGRGEPRGNRPDGQGVSPRRHDNRMRGIPQRRRIRRQPRRAPHLGRRGCRRQLVHDERRRGVRSQRHRVRERGAGPGRRVLRRCGRAPRHRGGRRGVRAIRSPAPSPPASGAR